VSDRVTVLIIGGYGTFGGRIVELLQNEPHLTLQIAGRSLQRAGAFRAAHGNARANLVAVAFDRGGDIAAQLSALRPNIVVDASGPFQTYGYHVVEACIAQRMNYLDLADDPKFVAGVCAFDDAARAAGVFVLSGVSSFPVLTAAAVRRLAAGMVRIDTIRGGIAPSPYAGVGANVIRAIAGYAGQPVTLRRSNAPATAHPFTEQMQFTIAPPGCLPLRSRMFSLVEVPDLRVLAELWPDVATVWIGAAPVPAVLHRALIALAWLTRWRLLPTLSPLAPLMHFATNHLRWGEHRGGMFVAIEATDASGRQHRRSWHLLAERDDGPLIPSMAVAALVLRMLGGATPSAGARAATRELEVDDYQPLFAGRAIVTGVRDEPPEPTAPLYARVLGAAWHQLPIEIRAMHNVGDHASASGRASVERGRGLLARLAAGVIGFPEPSSDTPVSVRFAAENGVETWTRTFGSKSFASRQFAGLGMQQCLLCERFGPLTFAMALVVQNTRLALVLRGWSCFGITLPMWLGPRAFAYEAVEAGKFRFHVEIGHWLTGLIIRYRGWLEPDRPSGLATAADDTVTPVQMTR
jgi:hypothetical protein